MVFHDIRKNSKPLFRKNKQTKTHTTHSLFPFPLQHFLHYLTPPSTGTPSGGSPPSSYPSCFTEMDLHELERAEKVLRQARDSNSLPRSVEEAEAAAVLSPASVQQLVRDAVCAALGAHNARISLLEASHHLDREDQKEIVASLQASLAGAEQTLHTLQQGSTQTPALATLGEHIRDASGKGEAVIQRLEGDVPSVLSDVLERLGDVEAVASAQEKLKKEVRVFCEHTTDLSAEADKHTTVLTTVVAKLNHAADTINSLVEENAALASRQAQLEARLDRETSSSPSPSPRHCANQRTVTQEDMNNVKDELTSFQASVATEIEGFEEKVMERVDAVQGVQKDAQYRVERVERSVAFCEEKLASADTAGGEVLGEMVCALRADFEGFRHTQGAAAPDALKAAVAQKEGEEDRHRLVQLESSVAKLKDAARQPRTHGATPRSSVLDVEARLDAVEAAIDMTAHQLPRSPHSPQPTQVTNVRMESDLAQLAHRLAAMETQIGTHIEAARREIRSVEVRGNSAATSALEGLAQRVSSVEARVSDVNSAHEARAMSLAGRVAHNEKQLKGLQATASAHAVPHAAPAPVPIERSLTTTSPDTAQAMAIMEAKMIELGAAVHGAAHFNESITSRLFVTEKGLQEVHSKVRHVTSTGDVFAARICSVEDALRAGGTHDAGDVEAKLAGFEAETLTLRKKLAEALQHSEGRAFDILKQLAVLQTDVSDVRGSVNDSQMLVDQKLHDLAAHIETAQNESLFRSIDASSKRLQTFLSQQVEEMQHSLAAANTLAKEKHECNEAKSSALSQQIRDLTQSVLTVQEKMSHVGDPQSDLFKRLCERTGLQQEEAMRVFSQRFVKTDDFDASMKSIQAQMDGVGKHVSDVSARHDAVTARQDADIHKLHNDSSNEARCCALSQQIRDLTQSVIAVQEKMSQVGDPQSDLFKRLCERTGLQQEEAMRVFSQRFVKTDDFDASVKVMQRLVSDVSARQDKALHVSSQRFVKTDDFDASMKSMQAQMDGVGKHVSDISTRHDAVTARQDADIHKLHNDSSNEARCCALSQQIRDLTQSVIAVQEKMSQVGDPQSDLFKDLCERTGLQQEEALREFAQRFVKTDEFDASMKSMQTHMDGVGKHVSDITARHDTDIHKIRTTDREAAHGFAERLVADEKQRVDDIVTSLAQRSAACEAVAERARMDVAGVLQESEKARHQVTLNAERIAHILAPDGLLLSARGRIENLDEKTGLFQAEVNELRCRFAAVEATADGERAKRERQLHDTRNSVEERVRVLADDNLLIKQRFAELRGTCVEAATESTSTAAAVQKRLVDLEENGSNDLKHAADVEREVALRLGVVEQSLATMQEGRTVERMEVVVEGLQQLQRQQHHALAEVVAAGDELATRVGSVETTAAAQDAETLLVKEGLVKAELAVDVVAAKVAAVETSVGAVVAAHQEATEGTTAWLESVEAQTKATEDQVHMCRTSLAAADARLEAEVAERRVALGSCEASVAALEGSVRDSTLQAFTSLRSEMHALVVPREVEKDVQPESDVHVTELQSSVDDICDKVKSFATTADLQQVQLAVSSVRSELKRVSTSSTLLAQMEENMLSERVQIATKLEEGLRRVEKSADAHMGAAKVSQEAALTALTERVHECEGAAKEADLKCDSNTESVLAMGKRVQAVETSLDNHRNDQVSEAARLSQNVEKLSHAVDTLDKNADASISSMEVSLKSAVSSLTEQLQECERVAQASVADCNTNTTALSQRLQLAETSITEQRNDTGLLRQDIDTVLLSVDSLGKKTDANISGIEVSMEQGLSSLAMCLQECEGIAKEANHKCDSNTESVLAMGERVQAVETSLDNHRNDQVSEAARLSQNVEKLSHAVDTLDKNADASISSMEVSLKSAVSSLTEQLQECERVAQASAADCNTNTTALSQRLQLAETSITEQRDEIGLLHLNTAALDKKTDASISDVVALCERNTESISAACERVHGIEASDASSERADTACLREEVEKLSQTVKALDSTVQQERKAAAETRDVVERSEKRAKSFADVVEEDLENARRVQKKRKEEQEDELRHVRREGADWAEAVQADVATLRATLAAVRADSDDTHTSVSDVETKLAALHDALKQHDRTLVGHSDALRDLHENAASLSIVVDNQNDLNSDMKSAAAALETSLADKVQRADVVKIAVAEVANYNAASQAMLLDRLAACEHSQQALARTCAKEEATQLCAHLERDMSQRLSTAASEAQDALRRLEATVQEQQIHRSASHSAHSTEERSVSELSTQQESTHTLAQTLMLDVQKLDAKLTSIAATRERDMDLFQELQDTQTAAMQAQDQTTLHMANLNTLSKDTAARLDVAFHSLGALEEGLAHATLRTGETEELAKRGISAVDRTTSELAEKMDRSVQHTSCVAEDVSALVAVVQRNEELAKNSLTALQKDGDTIFARIDTAVKHIGTLDSKVAQLVATSDQPRSPASISPVPPAHGVSHEQEHHSTSEFASLQSKVASLGETVACNERLAKQGIAALHEDDKQTNARVEEALRQLQHLEAGQKARDEDGAHAAITAVQNSVVALSSRAEGTATALTALQQGFEQLEQQAVRSSSFNAVSIKLAQVERATAGELEVLASHSQLLKEEIFERLESLETTPPELEARLTTLQDEVTTSVASQAAVLDMVQPLLTQFKSGSDTQHISAVSDAVTNLTDRVCVLEAKPPRDAQSADVAQLVQDAAESCRFAFERRVTEVEGRCAVAQKEVSLQVASLGDRVESVENAAQMNYDASPPRSVSAKDDILHHVRPMLTTLKTEMQATSVERLAAVHTSLNKSMDMKLQEHSVVVEGILSTRQAEEICTDSMDSTLDSDVGRAVPWEAFAAHKEAVAVEVTRLASAVQAVAETSREQQHVLQSLQRHNVERTERSVPRDRDDSRFEVSRFFPLFLF